MCVYISLRRHRRASLLHTAYRTIWKMFHPQYCHYIDFYCCIYLYTAKHTRQCDYVLYKCVVVSHAHTLWRTHVSIINFIAFATLMLLFQTNTAMLYCMKILSIIACMNFREQIKRICWLVYFTRAATNEAISDKAHKQKKTHIHTYISTVH